MNFSIDDDFNELHLDPGDIDSQGNVYIERDTAVITCPPHWSEASRKYKADRVRRSREYGDNNPSDPFEQEPAGSDKE